MGRFKKFKKSNKHKKLKPVDPFYTGSRKDDLWKTNVVNNTAKNIEDQPMPRKLKELQKIREDMKKGIDYKQQRYLMNEKSRNRGGKKTVEPVPSYSQGKRETGRHFLKRVQCETVAYIAKFKQEEKMGLHPDEPDEIKKKKKKQATTPKEPSASASSESAKTDGSKKTPSKPSKLAQQAANKTAAPATEDHRKERMTEKRDKLHSRKQFNSDKRSTGFEHLKDKVEFGEQSHRPPVITVRPRGAKGATLNRPGRKESLLLHKQMSQKVAAPSMARQLRLQQGHDDAVAAYRQLKKEQRSQALPRRAKDT